MKIDVKLQLRVGGMVLLILGPVLALLGAALDHQASQAQGWSTLEARVLQSRVEVVKKASSWRRGRTSFQDYYNAVIQYEYVVNGQQLTGERIGLDPSVSSGFARSEAERWVRRYPVGATVKIHYSPRDPSQSVIYPWRDDLGVMLMMVFGVLAPPVGWALRRWGRVPLPAEAPAGPFFREAAAEAAPEAAAPGDQGPLMQQAGIEPARPTHWLIRAILLAAGLVIFIFGCLGLKVGVKLLLRSANAPGLAAVSMIVHLVMVLIMAGITLSGAYLI